MGEVAEAVGEPADFSMIKLMASVPPLETPAVSK